ALFVLAIPSKDHVLRYGLVSLSTVVVLAVAGLPLAVGVTLLVNSLGAGRAAHPCPGGPPGAEESPPPSRRVCWGWAAGTAILLSGLATVLYLQVPWQASLLPGLEGVDVRYQPLLGWWPVGIGGALFFSCLLARAALGASWSRNLALTGGAAL